MINSNESNSNESINTDDTKDTDSISSIDDFLQHTKESFGSIMLSNNPPKDEAVSNVIGCFLTVSVAESVTAGALSNTLCSEPGSSKFFLGGIIAYNMETQKNLLNVDEVYAEKNNFANAFTTFSMAQNVTKIFKSRIGLSTTGYSLPLYREANLENNKCEINVQTPYAYICLYDSETEYNVVYKIINDNYTKSSNQKIQRAQMQSKIALESKKIFEEYCLKIKKNIV